MNSLIKSNKMFFFSPFFLQNYKKIFKSNNDSFTLNKTFFVKAANINFIYLLTPFIVKNFKKSLKCIQSYEDVPVSTQNDLFAPI